MRTKVMLLIAADNVSGPVKGVLQLIENLDPRVSEIDLYNFQCLDEQKTLFFNVAREKNLPVHFLILKRRAYLSLIRKILLEVKENKYVIIQTHGFKPTFLGFFARLFGNVKWICFMHGTTNENLKVRLYNLVDNILQLASHRTVLVSESQRRKVYGGRNVKRVCILHNAVDMECPMPMSLGARPLRKLFDLPVESKVVVAVGRFSPEKGIDVLLDAFALLVRQVKDTHLILVGDGQERLTLETQVQRLGLAGVVHFAGYTKTPGDYVAEADLFVLPSRSEGIPNAVLEAMAMGKPVVATAVGGVPEIIVDGTSGRLVPPEQPHLLAQAIVEVLSDQKLCQRLATEGKRRVQESFSIQARVDKLQALYSDVLSEAS